MALLSQDETLALINAKAKEVSDSFLVKVFRKRHTTGLPESVATFGDAQAVHIVSPETWLPRIAGGGPIFLLQAYHSADPAVTIGSPIQVSVPTDNLNPKSPGEIDPRVVKSGSWTGPRVLVWPSVEDKKSDPSPSYSVPSALPPAFPPGAAPQQSVSTVVTPGAFDKAAFDRNLALQQQVDSERAQFLRLKEEHAEDLRRQREEFAEARRSAEIDALKRENEARVREMQAEMRALVASQAQAHQAPKTDIAQTIAAITTAATPILVQMLSAQNEMRLAMLKQQEATAAVAAESNRQLMASLLTKPAVDPVMERLFSELKSTIEKSNAQQTPQSTMLHSMAETTASMTQTMMELVQSAADMNLGGGKQEDHPALKAVREGVKAVQSLFAGYQTATMNKMGLQQQPQQIPNGHAPQFNGYQQQQQLPPPPQQVQQAPQAPQAPVAAPQATPLQGLPQAKNVVEHLENMFKVQAPAEEIAKVFVNALKNGDKDLAAALDEVGGVMEELFKKRLGTFIMANPHYMEYGNAVILKINEVGEREGIFEDESDDEEEQFTEEDAA